MYETIDKGSSTLADFKSSITILFIGGLDTNACKIDTYYMKTSDAFTTVRIIFAPIFFILYMFPIWTGLLDAVSIYVIVPLLLFAEFTDFLDGFYARKYNVVSDFGKIFDPFADVLLHLTTFFCFLLSGYMPAIFFIFILYREFGMLFIRLMATKKGITMGARKGGKLKTVLYVVASFYSLFLESCVRLAIVLPADFEFLTTIGYVLYGIALLASYVSFGDYIMHFTKLIRSEKK